MGDSGPICRICLGEDDEASFCSPCDCSGTQKWVHPDCLTTWRREVGCPKASRCQVCRAKYSVPFSPPDPPSDSKVTPTHLVLALLISLAIGTVVPLIGIALFWGLGVVRSCISLARFPDGALGLIRQGEPVPELDVGVMLVATSQMREGSCFFESVVLMLDHAPGVGSRGVVLNLRDSPSRAGDRVVGVGGPVGVNMPEVWTILHDAGPGIGHSDFVFEGVYAVVVHGHDQMLQMLATLESCEARCRVFLGYAGWAPRQLDGEIRCGSWEVLCEVTAEDIFHADDAGLFRQMGSRLERVQ